jgi:gliding motility-associated-like protein
LVGPSPNFLVNNLAAGVYSVSITNSVSACTQQLGNIIISEPAPFVIQNIATINDDCIGGNGQITFELNVDVGQIVYVLRDQINPGNPPITTTVPLSGPGNIATINGISAGTYSLEVSEDVAGGCTNSNAPITINPTPSTDLQVVPTIAECNTSLSFSTYASSLTAGSSIFWDLNSGGSFTNDITLVDYTVLGNNTVYIKASSGITCDSVMSVDVTLVPTPTVTISVDTTDICNGNVTLIANADGGFPTAQLGYRWSTGETSQSITVTQSGTHTINVSNLQNLNCFISDNETVTIPTPFTVGLTSTLACDDGRPFTLTATATNVNVDYSWSLDGVDLPDITSQIQSITAGTFEVTATDRGTGSCAYTATLEVIKAPITPTNLSSTQVFCPDEGAVTLDAGPDFISYLWSTNETTQTIDAGQAGIYKIDATNNFNCITSDQTELLEDCIPKVYGPTAFRPGGLNNEYYLFTDYVDEFEIFIFNRWGEMVYQSTDVNFRWDGVYEGELLPADQYSWVVRYTSSFRDRGTLEQYGGVLLLR